ncbi:MAG: ABC transporter substrate-binding protein [Coriobacteriales bacterium]|jgi:NitT/TauT family transport system substrate-binding protein|nr:ABC transporter substrate-binding protein [Coriobacteriales bacterium]
MELTRRNFVKLIGGSSLIILGGSALAACAKESPAGEAGTEGATGADGAGADAAAAGGEFPLGSTQIQALGGGVCGAPAYIAKDKGFWAEEGIDVELVSGTFAQQQSGLQSGQFFATNGDFQFFPAINEGLDIKILVGLHQGCIKLLVPSDSPITSVADLKGKIIGVDEIGGTPWAVTSVALSEVGIDPSAEGGEVTWAPYDLSVLEEVAGRGEVDAFAAWDPFGVTAERNGFRVLVDIAETEPFKGKYCCFLYASTDAIENSRDQVRAIYQGWVKGAEWIAENPAEAAKIITDGSEHEAYVASEDVALIEELLSSYHYDHTHGSSEFETTKENVQYFAEKLKGTGYLPADFDEVAFVDQVIFDPSTL